MSADPEPHNDPKLLRIAQMLSEEYANYVVVVQKRNTEDDSTATTVIYGREPETVLGLLAFGFQKVGRAMN